MTEHTRGRAARKPIHPGSILREEVLPELKLTVTGFAAAVHTSRQTAHRILAEKKGITPEMALKIGKFCGNGAGVWLRMQQAYDLYMAEQKLAQELRTIEQAQVV
jgi:addiction module HigA family antidote